MHTMSYFTKFIFFEVVLLFVVCATGGYAQHNPTLYGDPTSGFYVIYKIQKKDNLFSVGKKYDVRYQDILSFNGMTSSSISVGQELKIPIKQDNFVNQDVELDGFFLPLEHIVKPKEGLYRIGITYFKTPLQLLMKWNNLKDFNLKVNQRLIVGYAKPKDVSLQFIGDPNKFVGKPYIPPTRNSHEQAEATNIGIASVNNSLKNANTSNPNTAVAASPDKSFVKGGAGFFEADFKNFWAEGEKGQKTKKLKGTLFNSNTGWNDGKFYAMSSDIPAQTFVKVTNVNTQQTIYVKVLGDLPARYKDKGFSLIISSAGGAQLGITSETQAAEFDCIF